MEKAKMSQEVLRDFARRHVRDFDELVAPNDRPDPAHKKRRRQEHKQGHYHAIAAASTGAASSDDRARSWPEEGADAHDPCAANTELG